MHVPKNDDPERDTIVIVFNEKQMNPRDHAEWAEDAKARFLAARQADIAKGIDPDAPKPLPPELQQRPVLGG